MSLSRLSGEDVRECLTELFCRRGVPEHVRSHIGAELTAKQIRKQLNELWAQTLFIEPGAIVGNGYVGSFNGNVRDELPNRGISYAVEEAQAPIEVWRREYNHVLRHSVLEYRPSAPEARQLPVLAAPLMGRTEVELP